MLAAPQRGAEFFMDAMTLLSIVWRRWFIALPILVLTAVSGAILVGRAEVVYSAYGSELLMAGGTTTGRDSGAVDLSSDLASSVVVEALERPEFMLRIREAGLNSGFTVTRDPVGALLNLTVEGEEAEDVFATVEAVLDLVDEAIELAAGPDFGASISISPLTRPTEKSVVELDGTYAMSVGLVVQTDANLVNNPFPPGGATIQTLSELSRRVELLTAVAAEVPSASYSVTGESRPVAPIISIAVSADDPAGVSQAYAIVREDTVKQLAALQTAAGVAPENQTVLMQLVAPSGISQTTGSVLRPAAGLALLGVGLACAAAVATDLLLTLRNKRRDSKVAAPGVAGKPAAGKPAAGKPAAGKPAAGPSPQALRRQGTRRVEPLSGDSPTTGESAESSTVSRA